MKFKKAVTVFLAAALTCSLSVMPVLADEVDDLKQQKEDVQNEVKDLQSQLDTLVQKMSDLENELISTGQEITQTEEDLKEAEEDEQEQYEAMKLRIKYMYEAGTGSADLDRVLSSGDMSGMLSQAEYSQQVHSYDREKLEEYVATTEKVKELKASLEEKQDDLESTQTEYEAQQKELNTTLEDKSAEIDNLDDMIQEAARKAQEEEEARQRAAAEAAARAAAQQSSSSTSSGSSNTSSGSSNTSSGSSSAPSYSVGSGNAVVARAQSCLGAAYVWGACSPGAFDCSGLVSYCLTGQYVRLGNTTTFMGWPRVSNPQPGDVCVGNGHCGIYIGGGRMIHAATEGVGVITGPVQSGMIYVRYGG